MFTERESRKVNHQAANTRHDAEGKKEKPMVQIPRDVVEIPQCMQTRIYHEAKKA